MNKGIQINVTGGKNVGFDTIVQGSYTHIGSKDNPERNINDEAFIQVLKDLNNRIVQSPQEKQEIDLLKSDLSELQASFKENKPFKWGSLAESAKVFHEKYGWAGEIIKKIFLNVNFT
ncbi:hypothetical protein [Methylobacterium marchantiae]|uniref:Uncharacterized protein n=1 Tax=Methylobacterium marchantiae TaxID=600331 RepID=A0ABW3X4A8_9HYPH